MHPARTTFGALAEDLQGLLLPGEAYVTSCNGEDTDFVRLNHGRIRQAGHVTQAHVSFDLIRGQRHAGAVFAQSGDRERDRQTLTRLVGETRAQLDLLADDPHLLYSEESASSVREDPDLLPASDEMVSHLAALADGLDLVGLVASGGVYAGFASSFGQRSWHHVHTFHLDWSCHLSEDRAVRCAYAGTRWDPAELERRLADARQQLAVLATPMRTVPAGRYRTYLAPAALRELTGMLGWGGFSCKAHRTRTSPLLRLATGEAAFSPALSLVDDRVAGMTPCFTSRGFRKAERVELVRQGQLGEVLISPRSAREFALTPNAEQEYPESLAMAAGSIPHEAILAQLGSGLYLNNLHYCNFSDVNACRVTGMTRFACFVVEAGRIVAPLSVMRFDDSLYELLGGRLLGVTAQRDLLLSSSTYGGRSLASDLLPGVLVDDFVLTA